MNDSTNSRLESTNNAYAQRVKNLDEAAELSRDEQVEAEEGFEHTDTVPHEEMRFVSNPEDLRKDVDSEEKFSEDLEDNPVEVEVGDTTVTEPATDTEDSKADTAKKTTAKKTASKKG